MKCSVAASLALVLLTSIPAICHAQEFSADVVYATVPPKPDAPISATAAPAVPSAKLYVSKDRMRFEGGGLMGLTMLVDVANHTTVTLLPSQKSYRQLKSPPPRYFRVTDAENACPDWQKAIGRETTCEKVGSDVVNERKTVKYKTPAPDGSAHYIWVDPKLNFVIKWDAGKAGAELRNIKEGPQSADLFVIPQGYEILEPHKKPAGVAPRSR